MTDKEFRTISPRGRAKMSFVLSYQSVLEIIGKDIDGDFMFTDEEVGQAFRTIANYEMYGEKIDIRERALRVPVMRICTELDRNRNTWLDKCDTQKKNRDSASKKKGATESDSDPPLTIRDHSSPLVTIGTDKDKDNDNDNEKEIYNGSAAAARWINAAAAAARWSSYFCDSRLDGEVCSIISYFFDRYRELTGREHNTLNERKFEENVINKLPTLCDDLGRTIFELGCENSVEVYQGMIDLYFETFNPEYWNIFHFMSDKIRLHRYYDYERKYGEL